MIRQLVQIQKRIVPDLIEEMQTRYDILHYVRLMQPIGRRTLFEAARPPRGRDAGDVLDG